MLSLVQTSQNRRKELYRFLTSLNDQIGIDFKEIQLIFIDQGNNYDVFKDINREIEFVYIKSTPCSLSRARNIGLKYVTGAYVGFPDDDCWYEPDTLRRVLNELLNIGGGVVARGIDENGNNTNGNTPSIKHRLKLYKHYGAISYTIFLKFNDKIYFDENMGVGSPFNLGSGEETDYLIHCMNNMKESVCFIPSIVVRHPSSGLGNYANVINKAYSYARGNGYLMKKNNYPLVLVANRILRPILGMFIYAFIGKLYRCRKSYYLFKGNIEGYFFKTK